MATLENGVPVAVISRTCKKCGAEQQHITTRYTPDEQPLWEEKQMA